MGSAGGMNWPGKSFDGTIEMPKGSLAHVENR